MATPLLFVALAPAFSPWFSRHPTSAGPTAGNGKRALATALDPLPELDCCFGSELAEMCFGGRPWMASERGGRRALPA